MDNENFTRTAVKKAWKIVEGRLSGMNKQQARLYAGYSPSMSRTNKPELTKAYAHVVQTLLDNNRGSMLRLSEKLDKKLDDTQLDKLTVQEIAQLQKMLAEIHKIMTPQVTIKEEQMRDGTTKRTVWGEVN